MDPLGPSVALDRPAGSDDASQCFGISGIVFLLKSMPFTELILPLNDDTDHQTKYKKW
jgi:hypothetical protein